MKKSREESSLQQGCVKWFRLQYAKYRKALFSVPNGGKRNEGEAVILKHEVNRREYLT